MLVSRHVHQEILAGLVVNQADDECPHDRTPLLIVATRTGLGFRGASSAPENGFAERFLFDRAPAFALETGGSDRQESPGRV
jgi:hypothetical protein